MSTDMKQLKLEAEAKIEKILEELHDAGVPTYAVQVMHNASGTYPSVNITVHHGAGRAER